MARTLSKPVQICKFDDFPVFLIRKTVKRINLTFRNDRIIISAPVDVSVNYILDLLENEADFYLGYTRKLKEQNNGVVPLSQDNLKVKDLTILHLFGKDYLLEYRLNLEEIKLASKKVLLPEIMKTLSFEAFSQKIDSFITNQLKHYIDQRLKYWSNKTGINYKSFTVRKMKTKWGSCTKNKRTMRFNFYLATFPKKVIDAVILHELCHIKEANHQKGFYNLVEKNMPDYRLVHAELKKHQLPIRYLL